MLQCILYNILNVLKAGFDITASELKSANGSDIFQFIGYGFKSLYAIPMEILLKRVMEYNEDRIKKPKNSPDRFLTIVIVRAKTMDMVSRSYRKISSNLGVHGLDQGRIL